MIHANGDRYYVAQDGRFQEILDESPDTDETLLVPKRRLNIQGKSIQSDTMCIVDNKMYASVFKSSRDGLPATRDLVAYDLAIENAEFKLLYKEDITDQGITMSFLKVCGDMIVCSNGLDTLFVHNRHTGKLLRTIVVPGFSRRAFVFRNCLVVPVKQIGVYNLVTGETVGQWPVDFDFPRVIPYNGYLYVFVCRQNFRNRVETFLYVHRIDISKNEKVTKKIRLLGIRNNNGRELVSDNIIHVEIYKGNLFLLNGLIHGHFFAIPLNKLMLSEEQINLESDSRILGQNTSVHIWKDLVYIRNARNHFITCRIPSVLSEETWRSNWLNRVEFDIAKTAYDVRPQNGTLVTFERVQGEDNRYFRNKLPPQNDSPRLLKSLENATFDEAFVVLKETMSSTTNIFESKYYQHLVKKFEKNDGHYTEMLRLANLVSDDMVRQRVLDQAASIHKRHEKSINTQVLMLRMLQPSDGIETDMANYTPVRNPDILSNVAQFM